MGYDSHYYRPDNITDFKTSGRLKVSRSVIEKEYAMTLMSFINISYIDILIHDLASVVLILSEFTGKVLRLPLLKSKV